MVTFVTVVQQGTFTAAARALSTDKARVSRTVSRLEQKLGARLLDRSTRSLSVTEVGRDVYERSVIILTAVEETEAAVALQMSKPTGTLSITTSPEFGALKVDAWIAAYLREYPDMLIETEYTNRLTDIVHEGIDVAIRVGPLRDSDLSARKLGELTYSLYASPDWLGAHGMPKTPEDLHRHDAIMVSSSGRSSWSLVRQSEEFVLEAAPKACVTSNSTARHLACAGHGIALLPDLVATKDVEIGRLKVVLPDWKRTPVPIHALFTSSRYMAPKVRSFVDVCVKLMSTG